MVGVTEDVREERLFLILQLFFTVLETTELLIGFNHSLNIHSGGTKVG